MPDEVIAVEILPWLGQTIVTQCVFDQIAQKSYSEFQDGPNYFEETDYHDRELRSPRPRRQPMIDLLTAFLREYGNINDFDIPPAIWS